MIQKQISFDIRIYIFVVSFFLFYQFIGFALSIFDINFTSLITISAVASILGSFILIRNNGGKIVLSNNQLLLTVFLIGTATFLFVLRLNWGIFDFICPTGILGITQQISIGKFPATYLSFPEITMNYHQGFLFISGTISYVLGVQPALALKMVFIFSFILVAIGLVGLFLFHQSKFYLLPLILFILISSISPANFIDLGVFNYVNVFEYLISNSWPLGLLGIILILFIISNNPEINRYYYPFLLITLSMSTANATVFSVLVMTLGVMICWNAKKFFVDKTFISPLLYFISLALVYIIPKYLPTAFLVGENYDAVQTKFKWIEFGFQQYILFTLKYFMLINIFTFIGLFIALRNLKLSSSQVEIFLSFILLISFCFPLILVIPNIAAWDNIHKFAILDIFLSIVLVGFYLTKGSKFQRIIISGTIFSALCSVPANINLFLYRTSFDITHLVVPNDLTKPVIDYLNDVTEKKTIFGFKSDYDQKCNENGFSYISQYAGFNFSNGYFPEVFLLSQKVENRYQESKDWWVSNKSFSNRIKSLKSGDFILLKNEDRSEFITKLHATNIEFLPTQLIAFENFSLFKSRE
jgi:hypothetical protein